MKKTLAILAAVALLGLATTVQAALLTATVANGGFETNSGDAWDTTPENWSEGGDSPNNGIFNFVTPTGTPSAFPAFTGTSAGLLVNDAAVAAGDDRWLYQSLGVVEAGDVGYVYSLDAGLGARGSDSASFTGTMTVAFRTASIGASSGTVIGTADSVEIVDLPADLDPAHDFTLETATFTPTAGDVGTEIFAVISMDMTARAPNGGELQFLVDEVPLSNAAIPEPSTLVLSGIGLLGLLACGRRRKRRRA